MTSIRIGAGAGFSGDRIEPAVELAEHGELDFLVFECLAERTIAQAHVERLKNPDGGFDPFLEHRMKAVLPAAVRHGVRIVTNMGAANPIAAARATANIAKSAGLHGLRIAAIVGDDVLDQFSGLAPRAMHDSEAASDCPGPLVAANVYLGAQPIVHALDAGADIVITGRASDAALFLAPMIHRFSWAWDDWHRLGKGTAVGHLLECAGQLTGGYFANPGFCDVPGLATLGFPYADVDECGDAVFSKVSGSGGILSTGICRQQLLYEVFDPQRYVQPDVVADFSHVRFEQRGPDEVAMSGASGAQRPDQLKVSLGFAEGYIGEGQISYAGPGAAARGRLALEIVRKRLELVGTAIEDLDLSLIGVNAVSRSGSAPEPAEVRARIAGRTGDFKSARQIGFEVEALYTNGPAGGGGVQTSIRDVIGVQSTLVDRAKAPTSFSMQES